MFCRLLIVLFSIMFVLMPVISFGEIYSWIDEHGQQHFSETAPISGDFAEIEVAPINVFSSDAVDAVPKYRQPVRQSNRASRSASSADDKAFSACIKLAKKVNKIDDKMRAGVSYQKLERLNQQRRQLKNTIWSECRDYKVWTSKEMRSSR